MTTVSLKELRPNLPKIVNRIDSQLERVTVTKRGRPKIIMLSVDDFDGLTETLNILSDKSGLERIKKGIKEVKEGKTISLNDLRKKIENV